MRYAACLLVLAALPLVSAAEEPKFQVPKTWEKVTTGDAAGWVLSSRDGFTIWIDAVLVERTKEFRAQSFTRTLYRYKAGAKEPEQLDQRVSTGTTVALLGPGGAVATGHFADCDTVFIPGHKPMHLPRDERVRYAAHHFTMDGLVCTGEKYGAEKGQKGSASEYYHEVVFFPIDRVKGEIGEAKVLRPWFAASESEGFKLDASHGHVFLRGDVVAYTGEVPNPNRTKKVGFTLPASEVWDVKNKKAVWRAEATIESADDKYAYWFPSADTVARRALDGKTAAEQLALPKDIIRLEVQGARMLALVKPDKEWVLTQFDLATGARTEFDLRVHDARQQVTVYAFGGPNRMFAVIPNGPDRVQLPISFEAATSAVRTIYDKTVYTIPVAKQLPAEKPKWEAIAEPK